MANLLRDWRVVALWALSLVVAGMLSATAQVPSRGTEPGAFLLNSPTVLSGDDVGFRLERVRDGVPIGRVVIRVDGRWVEPEAR
jgi:hypothetical protein